ncbi:hypothetical protein O4J56_10935 [Nocardiopsis sp. RSe5-2]|uniref:Uncharacterized protein n=1 Tax=Nocardiopsis endophytica TaxID=3018445 RepID=A0ABT4U4B0_9ACTN|nr:hypothetical protein [Nocardiopsis endophytica]MDA2811152.1 hypothetical protein [Nocardiopsis endophytica]
MSLEEEIPECATPSLLLREANPDPDSQKQILDRVQTAISVNRAWSEIVPAWMEDVFALLAPDFVRASVVPGCDFITCLTRAGRASGAFQYIAGLRIEFRGAFRGPGDVAPGGRVIRRLHGLLEWSGPEPDSVTRTVREVYPTPEAWRRAVDRGNVADLDLRLRSSLGFVESLWEERAEPWEHNARDPRLVTVDPDGRLQRRAPIAVDAGGGPIWSDRRHVRRFIRRNKQELDMIAQEFGA